MTPETVNDTSDQFPEGGTASRRATIRKWVVLALLLLLLALIVWATVYYIQNRRLPIPQLQSDTEEIVPPEYLFSIAGPQGENALTRPVGVAIGRDDLVYTSDTHADVIRVYSSEGRYRFSFSAVDDGTNTELQAPAYVVADAEDNIYVSDRRLRGVYVFDPDGNYVRRIAPEGEAAQTFGPLGMAFDTAGNLYVTDVGDTLQHRIVVFDPSGAEIMRFGTTGEAGQMSDLPGNFYFPNGVAVSDDSRLMIGDSNNRRVQVFSTEGDFDYFIRTSGIPRGMVIDDEDRLYVVDALSHTTDVYSLSGDRIVSFGTEGVGPGQFRYANDIALDSAGRIYLTDRENNQIQVWAWPEAEIVVPGLPTTALGWVACFSPLLLLPLLLLFRRKKFAVTEDFVGRMVEADALESMRKRRFKFVTTESRWPAFEGRVENGVDLGQLISAQAHSDSDARDLVERLKVTYEQAAILVLAKRAGRLCTEDAGLASYGAALEIETLDSTRYIEKYGSDGREKKHLE